MTQITARDYELLRPGTKGMFYWYGNDPVPVTFLGMDGVEVLIEGIGVRPRWHQGLHEGYLYSAFSWEISPCNGCGNQGSTALFGHRPPGDGLNLCRDVCDVER